MTIAELHGKLSPDKPMGVSERMEDLLTSDVFGTMKYAGWDKGFIDWIKKAEVAPISPIQDPISKIFSTNRITNVAYKFWPILSNGREPDLAMLIHFENQRLLLIIIEAKYFSGTSDWNDDDKVGHKGLTGIQITDQIIGLANMSSKKLLEWFYLPDDNDIIISETDITKIHLFVTMNSVLPVLDYEKAAKKLKETLPVLTYWLSWSSLAECLVKYLDQKDDGKQELLMDLYLLLKRKGLVPFYGFNLIHFRLLCSSPSFWRETYWSIKKLNIPTYQSFYSTSK